MDKGVGFRGKGFEVRGQGSGVRVKVLEYGVEDFVYKVQGLRFVGRFRV